MHDLSPLAPGYVRLHIRLPRGTELTPGGVAQAAGIGAEYLGAIVTTGVEAWVDVVAEHGQAARKALQKFGHVGLAERRWIWLRVNVGRNHGLGMGQLRKVCEAAGAHPMGRIVIANTHCLIGLPEERAEPAIAKLNTHKINGYQPRAQALPPHLGPGSPERIPERRT